MKKFFGIFLILCLLTIPVLADTVDNSLSLSIPKVEINLDVPVFNPGIVNPYINFTMTSEEIFTRIGIGVVTGIIIYVLLTIMINAGT